MRHRLCLDNATVQETGEWIFLYRLGKAFIFSRSPD
jgi:hypothetical protein